MYFSRRRAPPQGFLAGRCSGLPWRRGSCRRGGKQRHVRHCPGSSAPVLRLRHRGTSHDHVQSLRGPYLFSAQIRPKFGPLYITGSDSLYHIPWYIRGRPDVIMFRTIWSNYLIISLQEQIDISAKRDQHVVKCQRCGEATPIKHAPPGRKYVRCQCKCLLICKTTSSRIACPRAGCDVVINFLPAEPPSVNPISTPNGHSRVQCAYCRDTFLVSLPTIKGATTLTIGQKKPIVRMIHHDSSLLFFPGLFFHRDLCPPQVRCRQQRLCPLSALHQDLRHHVKFQVIGGLPLASTSLSCFMTLT